MCLLLAKAMLAVGSYLALSQVYFDGTAPSYSVSPPTDFRVEVFYISPGNDAKHASESKLNRVRQALSVVACGKTEGLLLASKGSLNDLVADPSAVRDVVIELSKRKRALVEATAEQTSGRLPPLAPLCVQTPCLIMFPVRCIAPGPLGDGNVSMESLLFESGKLEVNLAVDETFPKVHGDIDRDAPPGTPLSVVLLAVHAYPPGEYEIACNVFSRNGALSRKATDSDLEHASYSFRHIAKCRLQDSAIE